MDLKIGQRANIQTPAGSEFSYSIHRLADRLRRTADGGFASRSYSVWVDCRKPFTPNIEFATYADAKRWVADHYRQQGGEN